MLTRRTASALFRVASSSPRNAFLRTSVPRAFHSSSILKESVAAAPVKKPVGAFRGGIFGFLFGSTLAGAGIYYYILEEYRVSNELLTEDIYALQAAVQRIEVYTRTLEEKVVEMQKRAK